MLLLQAGVQVRSLVGEDPECPVAWPKEKRKRKNTKPTKTQQTKTCCCHTHYFPYREVQVSQTLGDEKKNDAAKWLTWWNKDLTWACLKNCDWASLVVQWLRICLSTQGTRAQALVREDPTCRGATKPMRQNCWACALEPVLRNKRSHRNEKPAHHNEE